MEYDLGRSRLRTGEMLEIRCVEPPEPVYEKELAGFFSYKRDTTLRNISERVRGLHAADCRDRYFIGKIDGKIVASLWYGLPVRGIGIGNFGNTFTVPEHRGKGIMKQLMRLLSEDFQKSAGVALFCVSGEMTGNKIYGPAGFEFISEERSGGGRPMMNLKKEYAGSLDELESVYFKPGGGLSVRPGNAADHFIFDKFMPHTKGFKKLSERWHSVFLCSRIKNYLDAFFMAGDGLGEVLAAEMPGGRAAGYAFILFIGSSVERECATMDFFIHPGCLPAAGEFIRKASSEAGKKGIRGIRTYINSADEEKLSIFRECGFKEEFRLADYCHERGRSSDIIGLRRFPPAGKAAGK